MKKLIVLLLVLMLVLVMCGCNKPEEYVSSYAEATTEPTTEATTEPTTEPTEPPVLYRNPLNGTPLEEEYKGRAVAVVINNLNAALPQSGIESADFLYEVETEGGITRFLAVFSNLEGVGAIGPVRSARTFFNNVALSFDAPIVHCGGSVRGRNAYADLSGGKISDWEHLDQVYNGSYFYRDQDRLSSGYSREHTLFTTGKELMQAMADKGYAEQESVDYGFLFDEEPAVDGFVANKLTVKFRNSKTTTFTYNESTGLYAAEQYGIDHIDANTGNQMTFRNVMVVYTSQSFRHDGEYSRSYYELEGEGQGELAINGILTKIKWSREDRNSPFVYTYEDGTPVTFGVGRTYVAIACGDRGSVEFE